MVVAYITIYYYTRHVVSKNSSRLRILWDLNQEFSFFDDIKRLTYSTQTNTKSQFDKFVFESYLQRIILEEQELFDRQINHVEKNLSIYKIYSEKVECISKENVGEDARKCHLSIEKFVSIENKLIEKRKHHSTLDFSVECTVTYTSPKGRNHYEKDRFYSYEQVRKIRKIIHRQNRQLHTNEF